MPTIILGDNTHFCSWENSSKKLCKMQMWGQFEAKKLFSFGFELQSILEEILMQNEKHSTAHKSFSIDEIWAKVKKWYDKFQK